MSSQVSIQVVEGVATIAHSSGSSLPTKALIPVGSSLLGSLVKSSESSAVTETPVTGTTSVVTGTPILCPVPVLRYTGTTKELVESILNSRIQISTESEKVSVCLRVMGLTNTPKEGVTSPNIVFSSTIKDHYNKLSSVCNKWRQPELLSYILKSGTSVVLSSTAQDSSYTKLKKANRDIADLTNTRGILR